MGNRYLLAVSETNDIAVDAHGRPGNLAQVWSGDRADAPLVRVAAETWAVRLTTTEDSLLATAGLHWTDPRPYSTDPQVCRALVFLAHRRLMRRDPVDGTPLSFTDDGVVATGASAGQIFPRIDPAVIGMIHLAGTDRILLARNRHSSYYSLVAGYVEAGESLEEAFAREAWEESGRRLRQITYWGSQPWPLGGSLMVGFHAVTEDEDPVASTDGELADMRWVSPAQAAELPVSGQGSIARAMIDQWLSAHHDGYGSKENS